MDSIEAPQDAALREFSGQFRHLRGELDHHEVLEIAIKGRNDARECGSDDAPLALTRMRCSRRCAAWPPSRAS